MTTGYNGGSGVTAFLMAACHSIIKVTKYLNPSTTYKQYQLQFLKNIKRIKISTYNLSVKKVKKKYT